jgi:hypothetical protein
MKPVAAEAGIEHTNYSWVNSDSFKMEILALILSIFNI